MMLNGLSGRLYFLEIVLICCVRFLILFGLGSVRVMFLMIFNVLNSEKCWNIMLMLRLWVVVGLVIVMDCLF